MKQYSYMIVSITDRDSQYEGAVIETIIDSTRKLNNVKAINAIRQHICSHNNLNNVTILNIVHLKTRLSIGGWVANVFTKVFKRDSVH